MHRVLHVSAAAERGGLEVILLTIVKHLDRSRFAPEVLFLTDGPFVAEVRETGIPTHIIDVGRARQVMRGKRTIAAIARLIRERQIGLIHAHNAKAHIYSGLAARRTRIPCILHLHGVPTPSLSRDGLVSLAAVLVPATETIACSDYVAAGFSATWGKRRGVRVVHNGVSLSGGPAVPSLREACAIPPASPIVVIASRLQRGKGVHVFLDAAAKVARRLPETRFVVLGGALFGLEKGYFNELRDQASRLGLGEHVTFTGHRQDARTLLASADVAVHCSITPDSFPTVVLEAMAAGVPVVASRLGGASEMIRDGENGFLCAPGDTDSIAQAIGQLLEDRHLRQRIGQAARRRILDEFTAEHLARRMETVYEEALSH